MPNQVLTSLLYSPRSKLLLEKSPARPYNFCSCLVSPRSGFTLCPGDFGSRCLASHG